MSQALRITHLRAWNLAATLMLCVIVFETDGGFGFTPASGYDSDVDAVIHELTPIIASPPPSPASLPCCHILR